MVQTTFLYYLVQIAHYQSLSIAADELHVSQPALSSGIKKLEEQLGAKLLERTYKGVTLTEEGKEVVELAKKAFGYLDEIEHKFLQPKIEDEKDALSDLIIYSNPAYSSLVMSALLANNKSENTIQFFTLTPDTDPQQLLINNSNVVILGIVSDLHHLSSPLSMKILRSSKSYIACSHEFSYIPSEKTTISSKELVNIPFAISTSALEFQKELLSRVQSYGKPNIKVFAPDPPTMLFACQNGAAACFFCKFFSSFEDCLLRVIPIRNTPIFHLSLIYNHQLDSTKIERLAQLLEPLLV